MQFQQSKPQQRKKYIYYLVEAPDYPNEIYATSKDEVVRLLLESIPDASQILKIQEASPTYKDVDDAIINEADSTDFDGSQDFFNNVIAAGTRKAEKTARQNPRQQPKALPQQPQALPQQALPQQPTVSLMEAMQTGPGINVGQNEQAVESMPRQDPQPIVKQPTPQPPKYFEESGMQFKLENGKLFKKTWVNVTDVERPEYRIISKTSNKAVSLDKYKIEKLEWVELPSNV